MPTQLLWLQALLIIHITRTPPPSRSFQRLFGSGWRVSLLLSIPLPNQLPTPRPPLHPAPLLQGERSFKTSVGPPIESDEVLEPLPHGPKEPRQMDELVSFCLLVKLWDETVHLPVMITKTKLDLKRVKGAVDFIELGNG